LGYVVPVFSFLTASVRHNLAKKTLLAETKDKKEHIPLFIFCFFPLLFKTV